MDYISIHETISFMRVILHCYYIVIFIQKNQLIVLKSSCFNLNCYVFFGCNFFNYKSLDKLKVSIFTE